MRETRIVIPAVIVSALVARCPSSDLDQFVRVSAPVVALTHVRVIDGTGAGGTLATTQECVPPRSSLLRLW